MTAETQTPASESPKTNFLVGEEAIADEIRVVQSVQTQGNMPVLLAGNLFGVALVFYIDWAAAIASHAIYFLVAVVVLLLPMLRSYLNLRLQPRPERVSKRRIRSLEIHSLLLGLVWAIAVYLILPALKPIDGIVVGVLVFYVCFGAVALMPSIPKASAGYICPMYLATLGGLFVNEILSADILILLCIAGSGSLGRTIWQSWRDMTASVRLSLEKLYAEAETHRRETEAMRSMLEAIPFPLVLTRQDGAIEASETASRQFGIPAGELDGVSIHDFFVNPDDQKKLAKLQEEQGRLEEYEVQFKDAKGTPFWALLSSLPLKYEGEDCWLNAIYVIDDRKRAEEALAEKETQLRLVMDNMPGGIRLVDKDRNYVFFNQQYLDLYDFPNDLMQVGGSNRVENLHQAERGDFGPGDPKALMEARRDELPVHTEQTSWERTTIFGKTLQVRTSPTPDGGVVNIVTDITERKQAENESSRAQAEAMEKTRLLQSTLDNMGQGLTMYDSEWNLVCYNRRYIEHFDLEEKLFAGEATFEDIVGATMGLDYGAEREARLKIVKDPARMTQVWRREFTRPSGRSLDVLSIPIPAGGFVVTTTDISDRKKAESELADKEAQLRITLENMREGISMFDAELKAVVLNRKFFELLDFPEEEFGVGVSLEKLFRFNADRGEYGPGDAGEQVAKRIALAQNPKASYFERTRPDGTVLIAHNIPVEGGGFVTTYADITESKRAEALLRESEQQLKNVLESSPVGVSITNSKSERVIVNQRYADLVGMPRDELLGGQTQNVWTREEDREKYARQFAKDKRVLDMEFEMQRADGATTWVLANAISLSFSGEAVRVNWIVDLTERKRAELEITNLYSIIRESIDYASNIQRAALPLDDLMANAFDDHFVIWEPRDVVGGDIYWLVPVLDGFVLGVADCTGHGVPGAFVTLLASGALRHALSEYPDGNPALMIASMNRFIKEVLGQYTDDSASDDGLEMGLCRIHSSNKSMTFAGARFSLWESRNGEIREIRGDRTGIGYKDVPVGLELTNHLISACDDASYYLFSDGFDDQIGGPKGLGLGKRPVISCLLEHQNVSFPKQADQIMKMFREHQGEQLRRDDLTMVGFKL